MNHEFNNREIHEKVLFSDECHAVQGSEVVVSLRQCAKSVRRRGFHKEHSFGEEPGQLAREL